MERAISFVGCGATANASVTVSMRSPEGAPWYCRTHVAIPGADPREPGRERAIVVRHQAAVYA